MNLKKKFATAALALSMGALMATTAIATPSSPNINQGQGVSSETLTVPQQQQLPAFQDLKNMLEQALDASPDVTFHGMANKCEGPALEKMPVSGMGEVFVLNETPDGRSGSFPQIAVEGQTITFCLSLAEFQDYIQQDNQRLQGVAEQIDIIRQIAQTYTQEQTEEILELVDAFENKVILSVHARNQAYAALVNAATPSVADPSSPGM